MSQIYTDVGCVIILPRMSQIFTDVGCVVILPRMSQIYTDVGCVIILPRMSQIFTDVGCVRKNTNSTNHTNAAQEKICDNPWNLWDNILKQNTWESVESAGVYNN